jgi:glycosyltransferase involved in cell wall biosynthesis
VVVIGRNEGERLRRSLQSVEKMRRPPGGIEVVYVDTASTDESVLIAKQAGARVICLDPKNPNAAIARNAGWREVTAPFVLFLDGDCQIEEDFAVHALERFTDPRVAVVWGRLREAYPSESLYNRLMDLQWTCLRDLPEGPSYYGTGIGLVRRSALEAVSGFDDTVINGHNTEMGLRMQNQGYLVLHVAVPMVRHDAEMTRFRQYWRRFLREGYSYARLQSIFRESDQPLFRFEFSPLGGAALVIISVTSLAVFMLLGSGLALALPAGILALLLSRTALRYRSKTANLWEAALYSAHWYFKLIPNFAGHLLFHIDKWTGRTRGLIEHR